MKNKRYGIQIDDSGDLCIANGGLILGDTIAQNIYLIIVSQPGDIKEKPLMGAGVSDMVGSHDVTGWKRRIREQLKKDGLNVRSLDITPSGDIRRLEADYD